MPDSVLPDDTGAVGTTALIAHLPQHATCHNIIATAPAKDLPTHAAVMPSPKCMKHTPTVVALLTHVVWHPKLPMVRLRDRPSPSVLSTADGHAFHIKSTTYVLFLAQSAQTTQNGGQRPGGRGLARDKERGKRGPIGLPAWGISINIQSNHQLPVVTALHRMSLVQAVTKPTVYCSS